MVEVIHPVMLRKGGNRVPHPIQRNIGRIGFEITQCHSDVGGVGEVGRGDLALSNARTSAATSSSLVKAPVLITIKENGRRNLQRRALPEGLWENAGLGGTDHFAPDYQEDNGTDDRHDEPGGVKGRAGRGLGKKPSDQAANNRPCYAEERAFPEAEVLFTRNDDLSDPADDCTNDDGPDNV